MIQRLIFLLLSVLILGSCSTFTGKQLDTTNANNDNIFAYSVFAGLANKVYNGEISVAALKQKGDLGLGTYNGLDGEMVVLNGHFYQVDAKFNVQEKNDASKSPFAVVKFFQLDTTINLKEISNYQELKENYRQIVASDNWMYTFKIKGEFNTITCGSAPKQSEPFTNTLGEALVNRPISQREKIKGTIVGFWLPDYFGKVNLPGFHLHFISDDRSFGGHVLDFDADELQVEVDYSSGYEFCLPNTQAFKTGNFDMKEGYNKKKE